MIINKLLSMKDNINKYYNINLYSLIENRLNKMLNTYVQDLMLSYNRLLQKDELKILKQLSKEN